MKESIASFGRRSWPVFLPFIVLGAAPLVVHKFFGTRWQLIAGVLSLVFWFLLRPWRFGLATAEERRQVRLGGTIGLAGLVLTYAVQYFRV